MKIISLIKPFVFYKKAIICETREEAKQLLEIASLKGYKWKSGRPFNVHTSWDYHDENGLVYYIDLGQCGAMNLINRSAYKVVYFKDIKEQLEKEVENINK